MEYLVTGHSNVGLVRSNNEDSYLIDKSIDLFVVADGMGGYQKGEVASKIACQSIRDYLTEKKTDKPFLKIDLKNALLKANSNIRKMIKESTELDKMGTTVISFLISDQTLIFLNVGDSRAYLFRNKNLSQISVDHSLVEESKKAGITKEIPKQFKNIVTRAVGMKDDVESDIYQRFAKKDDIYLLCSDGLHGFVNDTKIEEILSHDGDIDSKAELLIKAALNAGGKDNVTCLLLQMLTDSEISENTIIETETVEIPRAEIKKPKPSPFFLILIPILIILIAILVYILYFNH